MQIKFYGAAQEVTGSMHLIEVNNQRILLDCGLYQGRRSETYERNLKFPFDPSSIDTLVLSHAHIDHSGNIPNLVKQGFTGNIWCTTPTRNLATYMLLDSGYIHENDVAYLNKRRRRRGLPAVEPLYTKKDAQNSLPQFISVGMHRPIPVADGVTLTFHNAGHILGSAFELLEIHERDTGKKWRLVFSGDLGRDEIAILKSPETLSDADIVIMESTYGNRLHGSYAAARKELRDVVRRASRRRGKVIIPSFAVGRTQEIVFALNKLEAAGEIPELPVFVDSPLAVNATEVFRIHPEAWDEEVQRFLSDNNQRNPFETKRIEYVRDVRRSKQLNFLNEAAVIISASGMAENGRILHHLKNNIENPDNTVLFVGYQAENTLGRRLKEGESPVQIFGDKYEVNADVVSIEGYSAHADQAELLQWARAFDRDRLQHLFVVHGEPEASFVFAEKLKDEGVKTVSVPERGEVFEF
jgi:metallo-beta-lactamase family protein